MAPLNTGAMSERQGSGYIGRPADMDPDFNVDPYPVYTIFDDDRQPHPPVMYGWAVQCWASQYPVPSFK